MDYQGRKHPLTILYRPLPEGIGGYFSDNVSRTGDIGINVAPVGCAVQSTLDPLAAKRVLLIAIVPHWQRVKIKKTGFTGVGLFRDQCMGLLTFDCPTI